MYFFRAFFATIILRNAVANDDIDTMCATVKPTPLQQSQDNAVVAHFIENGSIRAQGVTVKIDTYWHTMKEPDGNLGNTDTDVENSMKVLNDAFAPEFEFVLKKTTVTTDNYWPLNMNNDSPMKNALHEGDRSALNIWSTELRGGLLGYATFPTGRDSNNDGVVILYSSVPGGTASPYNGGDTLTHEVGHWLMLYHTFQGGCSENGDSVDDTPAVASPGSDCPSGRDSCVDNQGEDLIENYMDYTTDECKDSFTAGQRTRMTAAWEEYRETGQSIDTEKPTSCADITKGKKCIKMNSCSWTPGKKRKKGKCRKVNGQHYDHLTVPCCIHGPFGSPDFEACCALGTTCPKHCIGW